MDNSTSLSFWIPIVPQNTDDLSMKEWVRWKADQLLSFGHQVYRLETNDQVKLEKGPARTFWDVAIQVALLTTGIFALAALIIKAVDRYTHDYKLIHPSQPNSPVVTQKATDEQTSPLAEKKTPRPKANPIAPILEKKQGSDLKAGPDVAVQKAAGEKESPAGISPGKEEIQTKKLPLEDSPIQLPPSESENDLEAALLAFGDDPFVEDPADLEEKEPEKHDVSPTPSPAALAKEEARQAEELRLKAEEQKKKEERQKKDFEKAVKYQQVASRFFPKMLDMFYDKDGELNNELAKNQAYNKFWGEVGKNEYPEKLLKKAIKLDAKGKTTEADACRKKAEENEKERFEHIQGMQQTFFPVELGTYSEPMTLTKDDCFTDCKLDFSTQEFFHGTSKDSAEVIKKEGFNPDLPAGRLLDTGAGIYLALNKNDAEGYAKKAVDGQGATLKMRVQTTGKFAQYDQKMFVVVDKCFQYMADLFASRNEEAILMELGKEGVHQAGESGWLSLRAVVLPLTNLFTRDFYARQGYRGVYAAASDRAGCAYLNIFNPKEDIVDIQMA